MKNTKERILSEGLDPLARHGLAGITLGVLAQQTGMSKSGLFAHFGSKEEVQLSLLTETARVGALTFVQPAMSKPPGLSRSEAIVEGWLGWSEKAGLHGGCPVAAGLFELDDANGSDPVRQHLLAIEEKWRKFLIELTAEAVAVRDLRSDLDTEQFVWELCGIYLAHHTSYRFLHDPMATERALAAFHALIARSSKPPRKAAGRKPN